MEWDDDGVDILDLPAACICFAAMKLLASATLGPLVKALCQDGQLRVRASKLAILMPRYLGGFEVVFKVLFFFLPSAHLT